MKHSQQQAVLLARVSSREQQTEGFSLPAQERLLKDYASSQGFRTVKVFAISETASKPNQRRIFHEMMTYVEANHVNTLVVEKVDRLVRSFKDVVLIDEWLEKDSERKVHFVKDSLILHRNARSQEKLNWGVRVVLAKNYIDNLREEVEKGVREKLEQGGLPGKAPLGYEAVGEVGRKQIVVNPDVAPLIKRLFQLYLYRTQSLASVTDEMSQAGLRSRRGRPLARTHIRKLLSHEFYIGNIPWNGKIYPGKHEPLVEVELFQAVQAKLAGKRVALRGKHDPLFRGQLYCDDCGRAITWELQKGRYYGRCRGQRDCGRRQFVREDWVEEQLLAAFDRLRAPVPAIVNWVVETLRGQLKDDTAAREASVAALRQRQDQLDARIRMAYEDRLDGRISVEHYDGLVIQYRSERQRIAEELGRSDDELIARQASNLNVLELCQQASTLYPALNKPERRRLLSVLFSNMCLQGPNFSFKFTNVAAAVAIAADKDRKLHAQFELENDGSTNGKEALIGASRSIWLGLWSEVRTLTGGLSVMQYGQDAAMLGRP